MAKKKGTAGSRESAGQSAAYVKIGSVLFLLAYTVCLAISILYTSLYAQYITGTVFKGIIKVCFVILAVKELFFSDIRGWKYLVGAAVCVVLEILLYKNSGYWSLVPLFPFVFCSHDVDVRRILECTIAVSSAAVLFVIGSAYAGVIENYMAYRGQMPRYYLGFRYALYPAMYLFNITACVVYLRRSRIRYLELGLLLLLNIALFFLCGSRLSFALGLLLICIGLIWKIKPDFLKKHKILRIPAVFSFPICCMLSFGMTIAYDPQVTWMTKLNEILGGRLSLGKSALDTYGAAWMGQKVTFVGNGLSASGVRNTSGTYNYVDCFYIHVLVRYGILFLLLILILATWALWKKNRQGDILLLAVAAVYALHGIPDDLMLNLHYNTMWIVLGAALLAPSKSTPDAVDTRTASGTRIE